MKLPDAARLAKAHGYVVRRVAPLKADEGLAGEFHSDQIDVETDSTGEDNAVVWFVGKGDGANASIAGTMFARSKIASDWLTRSVGRHRVPVASPLRNDAEKEAAMKPTLQAK
jgi:hypothetical protein